MFPALSLDCSLFGILAGYLLLPYVGQGAPLRRLYTGMLDPPCSDDHSRQPPPWLLVRTGFSDGASSHQIARPSDGVIDDTEPKTERRARTNNTIYPVRAMVSINNLHMHTQKKQHNA
uniref:Uncharacterized protein n=1 Tax=Triticum urartu TaxID=4572 RepID=A0A8R7JZG5_TRIUA